MYDPDMVNERIKDEIGEFINSSFPKDLENEEGLKDKFAEFALDHWGADLDSMLIDFLGYRLSLYIQRDEYRS
jgi:hypothetical protein